MSDAPTIRVSRTVDAPPSRVWEALTNPADLKQFFFGAEVKSEFREGAPITFSGEHEGKAYQDKGEIRTFAPERELAFTHWSAMSGDPDEPGYYNLVDIRISPEGDGSQVSLSQDSAEAKPAPDDKTRDQFEKNWTMVLDGLAKTVEAN